MWLASLLFKSWSPLFIPKVALGLAILLLPTLSGGQPVRSLYIDEIPNILSSQERQQEVLRSIQRYKVNELTLFKYFTYRNQPGFNAFINAARQRGVKRVSAGFPVSYFSPENRQRDTLLQNLQVRSLTFENDFWLKENAEEMYQVLNQLDKANLRRGMLLQIYFGWFGKGVDEGAMALRISQTFDRLLIHHYREGADFAYLKGRLETFGKAAMRYGRKQKVVVRLHVGKQYFARMSPSQLQRTFQSLKKALHQAQAENKALRYIDLQGFQIYNSRFL